MAEKPDPKSDPSAPGMRKPVAPADPAEPSGSSQRALRRKKPGDPSGAGVARPSIKSRPGPQLSGKLQPKAGGRKWLTAVILLLVLAGGCSAAYWYLVLAPAAGASQDTTTAAAAPKPPESPALFLPPPEKDRTLPRTYQADRLETAEAALRKVGQLKSPPLEDRWCDAYRVLAEPLLAAVGYQFQGGKVCQLAVRLKPERPYDEARAIDAATKLYGKPSGQYQYRTYAAHSVTFWEDARSIVKLDAVNDSGARRLTSVILMDKAGTLERAMKSK